MTTSPNERRMLPFSKGQVFHGHIYFMRHLDGQKRGLPPRDLFSIILENINERRCLIGKVTMKVDVR